MTRKRWGLALVFLLMVQPGVWAAEPWQAMKEGRWEEARSSWEKEAANDSDFEESHGWLAIMMALRGEHEAARKKALIVVDRSFYDWVGHLALAIAASKQKKTAEADRHYLLAMSATRFGFLDDERKPAVIAVARAVGDPQPYFARGEALLKGGKEWEAVWPLEIAAQVAPQSAQVQIALAKAYLAGHKEDLAILTLREVVQLAPAKVEYKLLLAETLAAQGGYFHPEMMQEAGRLFRELVKTHPRSARAHAGLAKVLEAQRQDGDALKSYQTAVKLDPDLLEAHRRLAWISRFQDRYDVGLAALRQIVRLDPKNPDAYEELAEMVRRMEGPHAAIKVLKQGLKANPGDADLEKALWQLERER